MRVTVTTRVTKVCPYFDETDHGSIELTFDVEVEAPELHALVELVDGYRRREMSHEAFTRELLAKTGAVKAVSRWKTAGADVVVEAP